MMLLLKIRIKGLVQGVGFRYFALRAANKYGITGTAKNEHDGSVYVEACGDRNSLDSFCSELKTGPSRAMVNEFHILEEIQCECPDSFLI